MCKFSVGQLVSVKITVPYPAGNKYSEFTGKILEARGYSKEEIPYYFIEPIRIIADSANFFRLSRTPLYVSENDIVFAEPSTLLLGIL